MCAYDSSLVYAVYLSYNLWCYVKIGGLGHLGGLDLFLYHLF